MPLKTLTFFFVLAGFTFVGGGGHRERPNKGWHLVQVEKLSPHQRVQQKKALAARDAMFGRLMKRLKTVLKNKGPAQAIGFCQKEAPIIAQKVAKSHGLKIGRTSFKLRNPQNQPPQWAKDLVKQRSKKIVFLSHTDGRFAAFLPIVLKKRCLTCHGQKDQIPNEVLRALAKRYPNDAATGFSEGDLRGWFWIEVDELED